MAVDLKDLKTIPYHEVESGPICENILTGDDVDVMRFPVPKWHERDGGRYLFMDYGHVTAAGARLVAGAIR